MIDSKIYKEGKISLLCIHKIESVKKNFVI